MDEVKPAAEVNRQYGELYYRADAVAAILRAVAHLVEAEQRADLFRLSSSIPTTMRWDDSRPYLPQETGFDTLHRLVQLRLCNDTVLGRDPIRLDALLRRGPSPVREADREYVAGVADEQSHPELVEDGPDGPFNTDGF